MAAIGSVLMAAQAIAGTVGVVSSIARNNAQRDQEVRALQERQALQTAHANQDAALERQSVALNASQAEEKRRAALKRAVARQRASFGAQGVGSGAGSSQAVLLGLFDESEDELRRRGELDALRLGAIDQDLAQSGSLNVLQRTQLAEKNKLGKFIDNTRFFSETFG